MAVAVTKKTPSSRISSKGQITVPIEVRNRLGLLEGDQVEFVVENGRTILQPARSDENPFAQWAGALPYFNSVEEINAWVRDMRDEDEPV